MREPIPPGTLDLMILKTLARAGARHGFEIAAAIAVLSEDVFFVEEGSLYPALQRMLVKGWVAVEWGVTAENRRAREGVALGCSAARRGDAIARRGRLARDRRYAVPALVPLALGIGATTAIFSVVSGLVFRPLPFTQPDALVQVYGTSPTEALGP